MFNYPEGDAAIAGTVVSNPYTIMVPDFIVRAIKLHKLNVIDIPNYNLVSKVCSKDDLALWSAINDFTYKGIAFTSDLDLTLNSQISDFPWTEFDTVRKIATTEEVITASKEYMYAHSEGELTPKEEKTPFYELKSIGRTILVVVQPGFLYHLEKSDTVALDFIRELIKERETASSQAVAASCAIYKTFLKLSTS